MNRSWRPSALVVGLGALLIGGALGYALHGSQPCSTCAQPAASPGELASSPDGEAALPRTPAVVPVASAPEAAADADKYPGDAPGPGEGLWCGTPDQARWWPAPPQDIDLEDANGRGVRLRIKWGSGAEQGKQR